MLGRLALGTDVVTMGAVGDRVPDGHALRLSSTLIRSG